MNTLYVSVRKIESVGLHPRRAQATAHADLRAWRMGATDWSLPLEAELQRGRLFRIFTTMDSAASDDGAYSEEGSVFMTPWVSNDQEPGMTGEQIQRLVRNSDAYIQYNPKWTHGWLNIQHPDAPVWFLEAVKASDKYKLRLCLRMIAASEQWSLKDSRAERASAYAAGHPLFFDISLVEFVRA